MLVDKLDECLVDALDHLHIVVKALGGDLGKLVSHGKYVRHPLVCQSGLLGTGLLLLSSCLNSRVRSGVEILALGNDLLLQQMVQKRPLGKPLEMSR